MIEPPARPHQRHGMLDAGHDTAGVDGEDPVPFRQIDGVALAPGRDDAGIGDQACRAGRSSPRPAGRPSRCRSPGQIAGHEDPSPAAEDRPAAPDRGRGRGRLPPANPSRIARPSPWAPPVMSAVLPASSPSAIRPCLSMRTIDIGRDPAGGGGASRRAEQIDGEAFGVAVHQHAPLGDAPALGQAPEPVVILAQHRGRAAVGALMPGDHIADGAGLVGALEFDLDIGEMVGGRGPSATCAPGIWPPRAAPWLVRRSSGPYSTRQSAVKTLAMASRSMRSRARQYSVRRSAIAWRSKILSMRGSVIGISCSLDESSADI